MTRATRPARTGTARPSARKARGRPLSYMSQKYASARPVAGKTPCLNPGWMFAMELTPDLGAARCRANGRRYHRAGQHRLPTASTDAFWASSGLISGAGATGNSRATLPVVAMPAGRKVGARNGQSVGLDFERDMISQPTLRLFLARATPIWAPNSQPLCSGTREFQRLLTGAHLRVLMQQPLTFARPSKASTPPLPPGWRFPPRLKVMLGPPEITNDSQW
jgi:hypothetical protein